MLSVGGKRASTGFASSDAQEDRERNRFQSETTAPTSFHPLDGGARTAVSSQDSRNALQASVHARRESCSTDKSVERCPTLRGSASDWELESDKVVKYSPELRSGFRTLVVWKNQAEELIWFPVNNEDTHC
ncbi:hypothetical protein AXG93_1615s1360 [Marchantia polymorpha subsp. ruderalis]|uniref:Uncharacterized protein n=1 Tax=Marchantia polymorpha subsp. ruderalis TaxID=1480154 RepID=A0A176VW09_MARPO|nr:hypothetical protein AXG93_1615s1360 [Marchantia polymorpha subsp. ruderalis]